jgi:hypothetical protein
VRRGLGNVFVASAGAIRDDQFIGRQRRRDLNHVRDGVGCFERGDNSFRFGERPERSQGFIVRCVIVFDSFAIAQITVLGADRGIVVAALEPDPTERRVTGLDSYPQPQLRSALSPYLSKLCQPLLCGEREPDCLELVVGDGLVMLGKPAADFRSPRTLGGATTLVHIYVDDAHGHCDHAMAAVSPPPR